MPTSNSLLCYARAAAMERDRGPRLIRRPLSEAPGRQGDLGHGKGATAATALGEAEDLLAELSADPSVRILKDDPNLVVARSQVAVLKEQLAQAED
jgi:hypothetical protein